MCFSIRSAFQRNQIGQEIGHIVGADLTLIGGHLAHLADVIAADIVLIDGDQFLLGVDQLDGESVLIIAAALDGAAVLGDDGDAAVDRLGGLVGICQRGHDLARPPDEANIREIGRRASARTRDAVTLGAAGLVIDGFAARRLAQLEGDAGLIQARTNKGHQIVQLLGPQAEGGHARSIAGGDHAADIVIRPDGLELLPREVDAGDAIARGAMAKLALACIEPVTSLYLV